MSPDEGQPASDPVQVELHELRARLHEAETTLAAIREGRVDAFVISGPDGEQISTLKSVELLADALFEQTTEAILVCDEVGRIKRASVAASGLVGKNPELQLFSAVFPLRLVDGQADGLPFDLAAVLDGETLQAAEAELRTPAGVRHLLVSAQPLRLEGTGLGALVTMIDVTAKQMTERALRRSEDALRESRRMEAIGRLAGGVAHEFNNVLTSMLGFAELGLGSSADPAVSECFREVILGGERLAQLTRQLLSLSSRRVVLTQREDLGDIVATVEPILRKAVTEEIVVVVDRARRALPIRVNREEMQTVVLQLVLNACDAMPGGGRLRIETRHEHVGLVRPVPVADMQPGRYAVLEVEDTGTGIPPDVMGRLFEPFFTTKTFGQSAGLGLAVVYGMVKQVGGHVAVDSRPGEGARFAVYLPIDSSGDPAQPDDDDDDTAPSVPQPVVLLVEDEAAVRRLVVRCLAEAGYLVIEARDGYHAVAIASQPDAHFDFVLADVVLPGLSGPEVLRRIRETRPGLPALLMSGYPGDTAARYGGLTPGDQILPKPFRGRELVALLKEIQAKAAARHGLDDPSS